ncbi:hypothetical protein PSYAC_29186, partial [Pseudomonas syringae pv. actinidiae str. M302091]
FAYFGPIKVGRRGAKRCLEPETSITDIAELPCDAERHEIWFV